MHVVDGGRKPTQTWGEHADSTQKGPTPGRYRTQDAHDVRGVDLDSIPGPSCCEATELTATHCYKALHAYNS